MTPLMRDIMAALYGKRFPLEDEKATQAGIFSALTDDAVALTMSPWASVNREVRIAGGIIDLLVADVGIEVKIKGQPKAIIRQLNSYSAEPSLSGLILVTSRPVALGPTIGGKPVAVFDMARAWL